MATKTRKKTVAKSAAVEKNLATAMERLATACADGDAAVAVRSKDAKKQLAEVRKLMKRRASLLKRKKSAAARAKKSPSADTRKALRQVTKDLAATTKSLRKARATRAVTATELKALKAAQRRANNYKKAIDKIDKALSAPKKRRRAAAKK